MGLLSWFKDGCWHEYSYRWIDIFCKEAIDELEAEENREKDTP